ncbi:hypothetical protein IFM89_020019 [Coptis chinensis]|uniref:Transcription factor n=1 Tax=Coptis chinensis TaxID=261450 RepID=A0A835IP60_9MAGN|nr:hypothetical protein IFM89_020019 [Coptis chinensis]
MEEETTMGVHDLVQSSKGAMNQKLCSSTKRKILRFQKRKTHCVKDSLCCDDEVDEEDDKLGVERRIVALQRLVPGGESLEIDQLFEETAGYILALQGQVDIMAEETVVVEERGIEIERENEDEKIKVLMDEIEGLKQNETEHEQDKKALEAISTRASQLEIEVSRLQHDFISSASENEDLGKELKQIKVKFEEMEIRIESLEKEKAKIEKEKGDYLDKVVEISARVDEKEDEIARLKCVIKEKEAENAVLKESGAKMAEIEDKYNEVKKQWEELKQEKLVNGNGNGFGTDAVVENGENEKVGFKGLKGFKWPVALASTGTVAIAAVAVYVIYARRSILKEDESIGAAAWKWKSDVVACLDNLSHRDFCIRVNADFD